MSEKLADILEWINNIESTLEQIEGVSPEEEVQLLRDTLEQLEGKLEDKLLNVARWRKQLQLEAKEVIGGEIKRLQDRKRAQERKAESLGEYLKWGLSHIDGQKIKSPIGSLWVQRNSKPTIVITDYKLVPDKFWVNVMNVEHGEVISLSAGEYKARIIGGEVCLSAINKDLIAEHYKETSESVPGTEITWNDHVQFR